MKSPSGSREQIEDEMHPSRFEAEGGKEISSNYLIDNRRLVEEFGVQYVPFHQRVLQIINEVRAEAGKPPIADG